MSQTVRSALWALGLLVVVLGGGLLIGEACRQAWGPTGTYIATPLGIAWGLGIARLVRWRIKRRVA